jgi:membrane protease YdiL (CAAX protease family)
MTITLLFTICLASYGLFFRLLFFCRKFKGLRLVDRDGPTANLDLLIVLHCVGILLFGLLPLFSGDHRPGSVLMGDKTPNELQLLVIGALVLTAVLLAPIIAHKNDLAVSTPDRAFTQEFLVIYFIVRTLFLVCYEGWFRGWVLVDCISLFNPVGAIAINITLYSLLHIVNGKSEMLACLPFGLLLCLLSIWMGAAWPAIIVHITFTLAYEAHLVKKNYQPTTTRI